MTKSTTGRIFIENSIINLMGAVITILISAICIPYAAKGLGNDRFGILSILWVILSYLTLADFGLSSATTKFTAEYLHSGKVNKIAPIFWSSISLGFFLGIIGGLIFLFIGPILVNSILRVPQEYHQETLQAFRLLSYALPFMLIMTSVKGMLRASQRFGLINMVQIPMDILNFIIPGLSFFLKISLSEIIIYIIISRIVGCMLYIVLNIMVYPQIKHLSFLKIRELKRIFIYGGWVTVSNVVSPLLVRIDWFVIGFLLPVGMLTFYSAPLEILTRLRILPAAIMSTLFPEFSRGIKTDSRERMAQLYFKSFKVIAVMMGFMSIILFCFASDILRLWLGEEFALKSLFVFKVTSIGIFINCIAHVPYTFLQGIGKPDIPAKFHLFELVFYLIIVWFLVKRYGINGAAVAWVIRVFIDFLLLKIWSLRKLSGLRLLEVDDISTL